MRALPERPFAIEFWDGGRVPATVPETPTFFVRRPSAIAHALRAPGPLGLGRAYVEGSLETDDIDAAFLVIDDWVPPPIPWGEAVRLIGALALAALPAGIPRRPSSELLLGGLRHSPERDAEAIRYHYDVGNDFFALFLDESMTYSCAVFSRGADTLAEAQRAKLDLIAQKLELTPGQRVLDVGCGWGSFAIHAAREYGVTVTGITVSPSQAELARQRVGDAGLADRVEIRTADYRELTGETYDAIASIGMAEHVGDAQIDVYARSLNRALKPGGLLLNHAISLTRPEEDPLADKFTMRYVFPDGEPLLLSRVQLAFERARFHTEHIEGFMSDYALTLRHWHDRLDERLVEAEQLAGAERLRIWRLYLRAARHGFDVGYTAVYQLKARKPA
ncbi:MAG TPA: cyclopropane-fatty-acyl-phospholipid synthase family protein [Solirubrobacteraceae bacterium]|jgi:cyclopropane-fatty-acyl-phospholipid synthase|nr:cyclopropane-fatty-acyl-phospholipid synthase family protein [Solirubrobacteraceae bacterium]